MLHEIKIVCVLCVCICVYDSCSVASDSLRPHGLQPVRLLCPGILQVRILQWVVIPFARGSSQLRYQSRVSCIAGRFLFVCFFNHLSHWGIKCTLSEGKKKEILSRDRSYRNKISEIKNHNMTQCDNEKDHGKGHET